MKLLPQTPKSHVHSPPLVCALKATLNTHKLFQFLLFSNTPTLLRDTVTADCDSKCPCSELPCSHFVSLWFLGLCQVMNSPCSGTEQCQAHNLYVRNSAAAIHSWAVELRLTTPHSSRRVTGFKNSSSLQHTGLAFQAILLCGVIGQRQRDTNTVSTLSKQQWDFLGALFIGCLNFLGLDSWLLGISLCPDLWQWCFCI